VSGETSDTNTDAVVADDGTGTENQDGTDNGTGKPEDKPKDDDGLKKALRAERVRADKAEKALREQELAKLPELERFKSENEALTKENEKLTRDNMRMKISLELKLPANLAKRLEGDTEEEMRADAADLLKDFKTEENANDKIEKKRPPNDAAKTGKSGTTHDMNTLIRIAAGRK